MGKITEKDTRTVLSDKSASEITVIFGYAV